MARARRLHKRRKAREAAASLKWRRARLALEAMFMVSGPFWRARLWARRN